MHCGKVGFTTKESFKHVPFTLVYGKDTMLPVHIELNAISLPIGLENEEEVTPLQSRYY